MLRALLRRSCSAALTANRIVKRDLMPMVFPRVTRVESIVDAAGGLREFRSERSSSARKETVTVPAALALTVEDSTFLVSPPDHTSGLRTVHFVLRCDGSANVIAYQLPEVLQRNVLPSELQYVPVISSSATKLSEEAGSKPGEYFTLEYKTIKEDVCSGKLLVIKHPDPHAIMTLCTQEAAWRLLLTSVGGRYAKLAAQDGQTSRHLQGPLLGLV